MESNKNPDISLVAATSDIRHSVCKWCYDDVPLDELCMAAGEIGLESIELLMPEDFGILEKHGLACAMVSFPTAITPGGVKVGMIEKAFNRPEHHDTLAAVYEQHLKAAAAVGAKQVICFSGNREGMDDEHGIVNCAAGLRRILPLAEKLGITLTMELLNSKVDHPDYMCDHTAWGAELCRRLDSANFGLLYDIYHMQIMEGDVIRTIRENQSFITHYHTGGNPGRQDIDGTQELHYPAIMRAILDTGYGGFIGHEFIPKVSEKFRSLREAVAICSV
jgi:hydroxypyruvate isomerase